ncbi:Zinc finger CCCH domain-containing protein 37 [Zea mays]|uniref:Zinc finger CCCH domain-containing protein 37 n=2 Tax=Zea mays TaxID=4577 RepID=A0A1D6FZC0_MAIZE|nr:Zinc finger CCCH domain-containing protein 37 [Zea mays]AQK96647.1 Zinc finger CCCH domain-containing protein 37 [Zea mays]
MSDPFYPYYRGAFPGGDGAQPPPRYSDFEVDLIAARYAGTLLPYPSSADVGAFDSYVGARRSAEVLYHQSFMGSHSTVGQNEALYSSNTMAKRPRLESSLPIYPQRPGQKDCAFYMSTGTCKYGETCKFDHPQRVPEGGVPNWKELCLLSCNALTDSLSGFLKLLLQAPNVEDSYPERPGEPDCPYLLNNRCKFKSKCKFNHPKDMVNALGTGTNNESLIADSAVLPVRPSEPICVFYAKTGKCKFGAICKFNHPKDIKTSPLIAKETIYTATTDAADAPTEACNAKGLPIRQGEVDCSFYMKTGSCKYGSICRFNHPDRPGPAADIAFMVPLVQATLPSSAPIVPAVVEPLPMIYPQRPGETVCDFYMKTGSCKYSQKCKFHHPISRFAPHSKENGDPQQPATLASLPRREDAEACAFYMRSGMCRFGAHCKFDHPPREEAISELQAAGKEGIEGPSLVQRDHDV